MKLFVFSVEKTSSDAGGIAQALGEDRGSPAGRQPVPSW